MTKSKKPISFLSADELTICRFLHFKERIYHFKQHNNSPKFYFAPLLALNSTFTSDDSVIELQRKVLNQSILFDKFLAINKNKTLGEFSNYGSFTPRKRARIAGQDLQCAKKTMCSMSAHGNKRIKQPENKKKSGKQIIKVVPKTPTRIIRKTSVRFKEGVRDRSSTYITAECAVETAKSQRSTKLSNIKDNIEDIPSLGKTNKILLRATNKGKSTNPNIDRHEVNTFSSTSKKVDQEGKDSNNFNEKQPSTPRTTLKYKNKHMQLENTKEVVAIKPTSRITFISQPSVISNDNNENCTYINVSTEKDKIEDNDVPRLTDCINSYKRAKKTITLHSGCNKQPSKNNKSTRRNKEVSNSSHNSENKLYTIRDPIKDDVGYNYDNKKANSKNTNTSAKNHSHKPILTKASQATSSILYNRAKRDIKISKTVDIKKAPQNNNTYYMDKNNTGKSSAKNKKEIGVSKQDLEVKPIQTEAMIHGKELINSEHFVYSQFETSQCFFLKDKRGMKKKESKRCFTSSPYTRSMDSDLSNSASSFVIEVVKERVKELYPIDSMHIQSNYSLIRESNYKESITQQEFYTHQEIYDLVNLKTFGFSKMPINPIKIAEASFSDVFRVNDLIYKIIPFSEYFGIEAFSKEVLFLDCLKNEDGICKLKDRFLVKGKFTKDYINAWETFKGSENTHPSEYKNTQLFGVLVMEDCGTDLEKYEFRSYGEVIDFMKTLLITICSLEKKYKFEHRDMHWGNIMIKDSKMFIIDFSFSRLEIDKVLYTDLNKHQWLFQGDTKVDIQFDVYKKMLKSCSSDWVKFNPASNLLWVKYLIKKLGKKISKLNNETWRNQATILFQTLKKESAKVKSCNELYNSICTLLIEDNID